LVERRKPIVFMVVMSFKMQDEREPAVWWREREII
jgi:hypothetical protein